MKRLLLATAMSLLTATSAFAQTVIIVRHAEKADASADPILSEAGQARARALAALLADFHPDLILVSPLQRTRLTAQPTADMHELTSEAVGFDGGAQAHIDGIVARIRALPAEAHVLVVGHSNTVPLVARGLGYADATDMPDCEFDRVTTVHLTGTGPRGEITRYGAPTACPAE